MIDVADQDSKDAKFVDELVTKFSTTSEEILGSIHHVLAANDEVAAAANEGAGGTTEISKRVSEANDRANEVSNQVKNTKVSTDHFKNEIGKFK